jgi:hypothetical protein
VRRAWSEVFWALNENYFNPRILYCAKIFKIDGAIKIFHDKLKLKQYMATKPPLQKILQGIQHTEDESKQNNKRTGSRTTAEEKTNHSRRNTRNWRVPLFQLHKIKSLNIKNN